MLKRVASLVLILTSFACAPKVIPSESLIINWVPKPNPLDKDIIGSYKFEYAEMAMGESKIKLNLNGNAIFGFEKFVIYVADAATNKGLISSTGTFQIFEDQLVLFPVDSDFPQRYLIEFRDDKQTLVLTNSDIDEVSHWVMKRSTAR